ncbi:hypothetical protein A2634_03245 [Candidatus Amesbacteria bacterium RIFCSPHIGHO2_01_FULL_48_32]|uniref:Polymerase nucleotidyl transferase domain-containing protein n=1 Tax=Candidatus Amesbacteria bacterium RIFCSPLOWO2_01_FULL_48_25 TaxID=1797259 RepID=A0A1F4ZCC6_9BACT|nr:MAG: hypothetical protein A2634_03245 [Candidatus Amesbacteria bacterium RIFCSPHIGHO2_01_FULL_48_32]OGD03576.1 MAG: hypothetical protein A2989_02745 [Candidatus Amesbacteria bacterium RIFCSPLOWO2_01_FULL_48_25]HJZ04674.1 nucleotidyltransferase family protein [Patescibacteria group bacterium]
MGTDQIISAIKPVLLKHGVMKAELFGSAARGEMGPGSDVDVLVELPKKTGLLDLIRLRRDLKTRLERNVDVVTYRALNSRLIPYVMADTMRVI